ncbi:ribosomal RNA processing protein 36 homolog isoform X2 [Anneissia japonica]|uniref:ribosomal RNA processing protein 36 homolog isoform X2 n=1 Tax=Anneissia japonica TaxID=1529436 RepID=UPI00142590DC|nr:ribosomal RNA processing protein 36 homolog isoform X2 [Anneissia japonica]
MEWPNAITDTSSERIKLIRNEFSEVPFEELHKLQEKLGTKIYDKAMYGEKRKRKRETSNKFSRLNKNRPLEMSSKKTVSRFREVIPVANKIARDPRFDDLSGEFKEEAFNQNYSFLKDVRKHEQEEILKEIKRAKNAEKQVQLQNLLQRMPKRKKWS